MSRVPRALAGRLARLERRAHAFHRYAHHPLCGAYAGEVIALGHRTRICRGCALTATGAAAGVLGGAALPGALLAGWLGWAGLGAPVGWATAAAGLALLSAAGALAVSSRDGAPRSKALVRLAPMALASALFAAGLRSWSAPGAAAALGSAGVVAAAVAAYRRRGPDRSACRSCREDPLVATCSGQRPILRRERAFQRLAGRWLTAERRARDQGTR